MYSVLSTKYNDGQSQATACYPYQTGYVRYVKDHPLEQLTSLFVLPEDYSSLQKSIAEYPRYGYLYVYGHVDTPDKPILGLFGFNPSEFGIGHGILATHMTDKLGVFHIVMSGVIYIDGKDAYINDQSGHFDEYFNKQLLEKYGDDFDITAYAEKYVVPNVSKLIGRDIAFMPYMIDGDTQEFDFDSDLPAVEEQRFRKHVCSQGIDFNVYPDHKQCKDSKNKGLSYCTAKAEDIMTMVIEHREKKLMSYEPNIRQLLTKLQSSPDTVTDTELRTLNKSIMNKTTPIMKSTRKIVIRLILKSIA